MRNSKKENPLRDLQSRYRSELDLLNRRKDQRRQLEADKRKIQSIPEVTSYLKRLEDWQRPKPPAPIGQPPVIYYEPTPPSPELAVAKGLREIEVLGRKKRKKSALIAQSIEKMAQMEVEAISRGIELPPRETPDDVAGNPKVGGPRGKASQSPPGQAFLSDFQRTLAEGQKALDQSKARQQDINWPASSAGITEEAVAGPKAAKAAKSEEQESEITATNGAKELDPADKANTDPEIPDELVRESAEEWDWDNERTYGAGHTISDAARILNIRRHTLYKWIKKVPIKLTPVGRISISEIKRVMTETKQTEDVQA